MGLQQRMLPLFHITIRKTGYSLFLSENTSLITWVAIPAKQRTKNVVMALLFLNETSFCPGIPGFIGKDIATLCHNSGTS